MKTTLFVVAFIILGYTARTQEKEILLKLHCNDNEEDLPFRISHYPRHFRDSSAVVTELQNILLLSYKKGFLCATYDSIIFNDSVSVDAYFSSGIPYKCGTVSFRNIEEAVLGKTGIREKQYSCTEFDFSRITDAQERLISYYEDRGYPFAGVKLDSFIIDSTALYAQCIVEKNTYYQIDSIIIKGNVKISRNYLCRYLGIMTGDPYNDERLNNLSSRMKELTFLSETKSFELSFRENKADLYLYLQRKKANQFYGILGVLPNNTTTGKLLLTGDVRLSLLNSFGKGEALDFTWQKLQTSTQRLDLVFVYPYLFNTPAGCDAKFSLFKKDTTYLTVNYSLGLLYMLHGGNFAKVYAERTTSTILSSSGLENLTALPPYADVSSFIYGLGYRFYKLDYRFNPRKGVSLDADIGAGNKTIVRNASVPDVVYEGVRLRSVQAEAVAEAALYIPFGRKMTLMIRNRSGHINNSFLFENELFRLGGLRTIRGFDEESVTASSYSVMTLEYRFLYERNSNFYVFADGAWYEKDLPESYISDTPFAFGIGTSLETRAGIFTISYAMGSQFDNPVEIRSAKIHFGYMNRF
ncbi:MAG: BamA/TamA family outer membrane protein [Bacteroidetes bacterium]|nr:BamA/TamA family outer membrane protein [Bacteroidota bacterium]